MTRPLRYSCGSTASRCHRDDESNRRAEIQAKMRDARLPMLETELDPFSRSMNEPS